jgi:hypothetical protein
MFRQQDWPSRLQAWAAAQQGKPFEWGTTDCAALARSALIAMFGEELATHLPRWDSVRGAALILQVRGSVGSVLEELGAERTTVPFMRVGDVVVSPELEEDVGHESVMVCIDGQRCVASTREGVAVSLPDPKGVVYSLWEVTFNG